MGAAIRVSWRTALAWRMERHHLAERARAGSLAAVAGDLCGLHAQVTSSAALSLWARIDGLERDALSDALCFAPGEGVQMRFTSPSSWLGERIERPATVDGLRHVARRFLHAY